MKTSAQTYIRQLELQPHPEGGYYRESYRSPSTLEVISDSGKLVRRHVCTGIYFLLEQGNFSAFHQIKSDEMWHFYAGQTLEIFELDAMGNLICTRLGANVLNGEVLQHVVPANTWFASRVASNSTFSLVGCTVAPGFDFADFKLAHRQTLSEIYPQHHQLIAELTRQ
jgi:predicted cupin superfamily sugar epimerase